MNFFMEVAKLRAARVLWAELVQAVRTEGRSARSAAHPLPDLAAGVSPRRTCSTMSHAPRSRRWPRPRAAPQSLHTNSLDEALALPTDFSAHGSRATPSFSSQHEAAPPASSIRGAAAISSSADRRSREAKRGPISRSRRDGRHDEGDRGRHSEAAHRGGRRANAGPHRCRRSGGDRRQHVPPRAEDGIDILQGRQQRACATLQIDKLDPAQARARSESGRSGARRAYPRPPTAATATFWRLAIDAARVKATVGEISSALEKVFGRASRRDRVDIGRLQAGGRHVGCGRAGAKAAAAVRGE